MHISCQTVIFVSFFVFVSECHQFTLLCLELLSNHLSLASTAGASACVLGKHTRPLRQLLFRLLDTTTSEDMQEVNYFGSLIKVNFL